MNNNLTFTQYSATNWQRCISPDGFNMNPEPLYLIACITQELGEVAAIITKLQRGFTKREQKKAKKAFIKECAPENAPLESEIDMEMLKFWWEKKLRAKLGPEVGDVFGYLDLFATRMNLSIPIVAANKFNEVSKEMECPQFHIPVQESESLDAALIVAKNFPEDRHHVSRTQALINDNLTNKPE